MMEFEPERIEIGELQEGCRIGKVGFSLSPP